MNLCKKVWIAFVVNQKSSDENEIEHYEKNINVKNIENQPVFQNSVIHGKDNTLHNVTMIGCKLSIKTSNIDSFDVFIALQKNENSYFVIRSHTYNSCIYYFLVGQVKDVKFQRKKKYNKSVSSKYNRK